AGVLYEQLSNDYSEVNERTWRSAVNEFTAGVERWQEQIFIPQYCRKIGWRFGEDLIISASVQRPDGMDIDEFTRLVRNPKWVPPVRPYIHPEQDVRAKVLEVRAGFCSRKDKVSEIGFDVEDIDDDNEEDHIREDERGLIYDTNPKYVSHSGATQSRPTDSAFTDPDVEPAPPGNFANAMESLVLAVQTLTATVKASQPKPKIKAPRRKSTKA
ncbi:MAG: hypothetical protein L0287_02255, partial [Anaerolineae bacterium]|nr:hypothetical protein [Anaerolineae bacterium]